MLSIDTSQLERDLQRLDDFAEHDLIPLAATLIHSGIKSLSAGGQDIYGKPFKPYTPKYEAYKKKLIGSASPVNMRLHNKMIHNPSLVDDTLAFWNDKENAKASGNLRWRKFFGVSRLITKLMEEGISKHINRL